MTADGYVTTQTETGLRKLIALNVATIGATAGDKVAIRTGGPTGEVMVELVVQTATGNLPPFVIPEGINIGGPLYYSEQAAAGGKIFTTVVFD